MSTNVVKYDFELRLLSSASHIGSTGGIDADFHRIEVLSRGGQVERVPCFTGNSLRGQLRDASALHLLRTLELERLPLKAFYLLFSGGSLEKGTAGISLEKARMLRQLLPSVSMWGAASGNHIMAGKWSCGFALPIAYETEELLGMAGRARVSVYDLTRTQEYTRFDDAKDVRKAGLMEEAVVQKTLASLEEKRVSGVASEPGASQQMRYRVETMIAGTVLAWQVVMRHATELEVMAWYAALATWGEHPTIGGKSAVGHGLVELTGDGVRINPQEVVVPSFAAYEAYLRAEAASIKALLYG